MTMPDLPRLDRRTAIKWMLTAAAGATLAPRFSFGSITSSAPVFAKGYGTDPDLVKSYNPGDFWPLTFTPEQRQSAAALCDLIIPADEKSPSASALSVHDFIDEWVSAPYPAHVADRKLVVEGLDWLEAESQRRFGQRFVNTISRQKRLLCDEICLEEKATPERKKPAQFFARFRDLTASGFYTTPEGMKDVGYTGNVPLAVFEGPPRELLKRLGLA